ncbi:hypothetical protein TWF718_009800 [Orbilia javanica]|uniref:Fido domain-containing protein n=1 Tax=Orbilia javanica TaxID=47235 RepID=A0AAN8RFA5_9PEZI
MEQGAGTPSDSAGGTDSKTSSPSTLVARLNRLSMESFNRSKVTVLSRVTIRLVDKFHNEDTFDNINEKYDIAIDRMNGVLRNWGNVSDDVLAKCIEIEFSRMIFGSNFIKGVGVDLQETFILCRKVLRDEQYTTLIIGPGSSAAKVQDRMYVVQHVNAFRYFLDKFHLEKAELTEDLIFQTHKILCEGHDHADGTPSQGWVGTYRNSEFAAPSVGQAAEEQSGSVFVGASAVAEHMRSLVADFNARSNIDPFELASWLCVQFFNIHPFAGGNGRMCRILLNGVLYKYTGIVACIGEDGDVGKDEYLEIISRSNGLYHEEDGKVAVGRQTSHIALTALVMARVAECGERMLTAMEAGS